MDGHFAVVRTDQANGFQALANDPIPKSYLMISTELGHFKNANKNPVAESAVQEVREHIPRIDPTARAVSSMLLSLTEHCIRQQYNLTKGFVCKGDTYSKGPVHKSTIAYIGPGAHITETSNSQCESRQ